MQIAVEIRSGTAGSPVPAAAVNVRRGLAWPVGRAEVELPPGVAAPAPGAEIEIEASGEDGARQPLLRGRVAGRESGGAGARLLIEETTRALAGLRLDRTWQSTTAGAVIADLASEAGVRAAALSLGAILPFVTVTRERTALDHALRLARASGLVLWVDGRGLLRLEAPLPLPGPLRLGPERALLKAGVEDSDATDPGVRVEGDGALGSRGPGAEGWVLADPAPMTAGDGPVSVSHGLLKTAADVRQLALAEERRRREQARPRNLTLAEVLAIDLFDVVRLAGFASGDGPARVVAVEADFDGRRGYRCRLRLHGLG